MNGVRTTSDDIIRIEAEAARRFVAELMRARGLPEADAAVVAACLVRADLRGVETHGIMRLPIYLERLERGLVNPKPRLELRRVTPVAAHLDGDDGLGFVVASRAMAESIDMAREHGLGLTAVRRSTHFGMAASYLLQAVEAGFIAFVFTNASPAMPPWGGRQPFLGTSPFAVGVPGGEGGPFILDMAPSVAARGKIRRAARDGQPIPEGYALDPEGRPTTDAAAALQGVVLPIGGPKGAGLSMLMDILAGVLTGAAFAGHVGDQYKDRNRPQDVGHFLLALRPDLFVGTDAFRARMDELVGRVRAQPRAAGFDEILMPGEPEARLEARRLSEGIPYRRADLEPLAEAAAAHGLLPLTALREPSSG
ncbi:MAG TPA: Ldh family oxidoreductase [Afifellaceae bacterium]|nr:Ldh family oxidoreductase [Afifellaceae bacterium]